MSAPFTASATVTTPSRRVLSANTLSKRSVCIIGPGSANPVVSITIRSKLISFRRFLRISFSIVFGKSPLIEQHKHPDCIKTMSSELFSINWWSSPVSPNSFTITATRPYLSSDKTEFSKVVFPAPRKPVSRVIGILSFFKSYHSFT